MHVLGAVDDKFHIRGRHSTVYPVHLPPFLHPEVVDKVVKRFEVLILDELLTLLGRPAFTGNLSRRRTTSLQSYTGLADKAKKSEDNQRDDQWEPSFDTTSSLQGFLSVRSKGKA